MKDSILKGLKFADQSIRSKKYDAVILDEAVNLVSQRLITEKAILDIIAKKPKNVELILTGRGAPKKLKQKADYVTDMRLVKHPYQKGAKARRGTEYCP